jgi:ComF family protein
MDCQPSAINKVYIWSNINQRCSLCDESTDNPYPLCEPCERELPWLDERCEICALPLAMTGLECGTCRRKAPAFARVEAPWHYGFPIDTLITRFKHNAQWPLGRMLAEGLARWLLQAFADGLPRPQRLLPVPMAGQRLRKRGFNQAQMLGHWLAPLLQIRCDDRLLLRPYATRAQQELDAAARRQNLLSAFSLADKALVRGLHVAIVDDVMTTGATAQALALLLRRAGAVRVDVYCLARTAKPDERPSSGSD